MKAHLIESILRVALKIVKNIIPTSSLYFMTRSRYLLLFVFRYTLLTAIIMIKYALYLTRLVICKLTALRGETIQE